MSTVLKVLFRNVYLDKAQAREAVGYFVEKIPGCTVALHGLTVTVGFPMPIEKEA